MSRVPGPAVVLAVVLAGAAGCPGEPFTQTVVRIDAHSCIRAAAQRAHVVVIDHEGTVADERSVSLKGLSSATFPLTIPIVPRGDDASRRFWVDATLYDASDAVLGTVRVAGTYLEDQIAEIGACFTERCTGVDCGPCTGDGSCDTCLGGTCIPSEVTPAPLGEAPDACPPETSPGCGDAGIPDAGPRDGGDPACDADGDGFRSTACTGGNDCDDSTNAVFPGAPESCTDGVDNDCDGFPDCYDVEACRFAGSCNARRCSLTDERFRICGGECVNVYTDENHCGSCAMRCLNGRQCTTTGLDGRPRCYCAADADCALGVNCNVAANRCGCNAESCGAGAHCEPGGSFPAYCAFDAE